jgi:hypothetical protein
MAACSPYMSLRFGGTYHLHLRGRKLAEQETSDSLATCSLWVHAWLIFDPETEVIRSSETSAHVRTTRRYIPEDGKFQSLSVFHRRHVCNWEVNSISYIIYKYVYYESCFTYVAPVAAYLLPSNWKLNSSCEDLHISVVQCGSAEAMNLGLGSVTVSRKTRNLTVLPW